MKFELGYHEHLLKYLKFWMGKLNAYQKRQILISFSIQTLSHTFINNLNCRSLANKNAFSILNFTLVFLIVICRLLE